MTMKNKDKSERAAEQLPLKSQLESLLFVALKPMSAKELSTFTKAKPAAVEAALEELSVYYQNEQRGLTLVKNNGRYQLSTAVANSGLIKEFLQAESSGELSQPSLEALTIIAYRGPIAKPELDAIRGVNCSLIIRNLLLRGLIEEKFLKEKNEYYYSVSHDFVRCLGLSSIDSLPDYEKLKNLTLHQPLSEDNQAVEMMPLVGTDLERDQT